MTIIEWWWLYDAEYEKNRAKAGKITLSKREREGLRRLHKAKKEARKNDQGSQG